MQLKLTSSDVVRHFEVFLVACICTCTALVVVACSSRVSEGVSVRVTLSAAAPESERLTTDLGYRVSLRQAMVSLSSIEVLPCDGSAGRETAAGVVRQNNANLSQLRSWFGSSVIGTAQAHEAGTPTKLSIAHIETWMLPQAGPDTQFLGEFSPPALRYCRTRLAFRRADAHTISAAEPSLLGKTIQIAGTADRSGISYAFAAETSEPFDITLASAFALTYAGEVRNLKLERRMYNAFDKIDFASASESTIANQFVANMRATMAANIE
jgi:hypothetical protein